LGDRFVIEKPKLPQNKPAGFFVVVELNGGVRREASDFNTFQAVFLVL
jgi:hypothetical protein